MRLSGSGEIWDRAPDVHVLLLGPEQLTSKGFENLLKGKTYPNEVVALGVDEVHLLNTWGQSFRKAFTHIGSVRMRFTHSPVLIALTATLRTGKPYDSVCHFLGLHAGHFCFIRRSNQRHDLRFLFRTVQSTPRAFRFPELAWVLTEGRRVIVFCRTIALTFRVAMYLRILAEGASTQEDIDERVRMYTALNWDTYNSVTLDLMHQDTRSSWVTVATDTLSVGIDVANTDDVILYDFQLPNDTDSILQKAGRIRDGRSKGSKVVVYLPKSAAGNSAKALAQVADGAPETVVNVGKGKKPTVVDIGVAKLVTATCKIKALDELYNNPPADNPCGCYSCTQRPRVPTPLSCTCSGCQPEDLSGAATNSEPTKKPPRKKVPPGEGITKKMRKYASTVFYSFRRAERDAAEDWDMLPAEEILPDDLIKHLLDHFYELVDDYTLVTVLPTHPPLDSLSRRNRLLSVVGQLRSDFQVMRAKANAERAEKGRQTRARKKAEKDAQLAGAAGLVGTSESSQADGGSDSNTEGDEDMLLESELEDDSDSPEVHGLEDLASGLHSDPRPQVVARTAHIAIGLGRPALEVVSDGLGLPRLRILGGRFPQT